MSTYKIEILTKSDYDQVFKFMQDIFRVQEPITSALGTTADDSYIFYKDLCSAGFQTENTSLCVRNSHGELIGIALNAIYDYNQLPTNVIEDKLDFTNEITNGPYPNRRGNQLIVFIEYIEAGLFQHLPSNAKVFKCDILCVREDYNRQAFIKHTRKGIGASLVSKSIELATQFQCSHLATCATAQASQSLFKRHGFCTIRAIEFSKFLDQGKAIYSKVYDNGKSANLMLLSLQ